MVDLENRIEELFCFLFTLVVVLHKVWKYCLLFFGKRKIFKKLSHHFRCVYMNGFVCCCTHVQSGGICILLNVPVCEYQYLGVLSDVKELLSLYWKPLIRAEYIAKIWKAQNVRVCTVPAFNSCTKCVGRSGIKTQPHAQLPPSFSWPWMYWWPHNWM